MKMPWDYVDPTDRHALQLKGEKLNQALVEKVYARRKLVADGHGEVGEAERILQSDALGKSRT